MDIRSLAISDSRRISYTAAGKPWISTEWLSEVIFAVAFKLGGWRAVVGMTAITCGAIIGLLSFYLLQNLRFSVAVAWVSFSAAPISSHFLARPHIFSYVLLVIWTIKLIDAYDRDNFKTSSLLVFAPLMVLWANLHGSFTFGLALLYVFSGMCFLSNIIRRSYTKCWPILIVVSGVTAAALMTPYGISSALTTRELLNLKYTIPQIIELHSPDFQQDHVALVAFVATLLTVTGLGVRAARRSADCIRHYRIYRPNVHARACDVLPARAYHSGATPFGVRMVSCATAFRIAWCRE
jgi:hypothetical protein